MDASLSEKYEREAEAMERSAVPVLLKFARVVVWFFYAVIVVQVLLLLTAFVLRLLGASTDAGFTRWVYRSADRSMEPFRGIFPSREVGEVSVLDTSLLFAAVVYVVVALVLDLALRWLSGKAASQDRRVRELRIASQQAALIEYDAAQQLAVERAAADQAARVAATAATAAPTNAPPPSVPPPPPH
jgi:uncharacterized protein YggT (Ycf19 family)